MLTPRKKPLYRRLRGGSNPRRCIKQDSEPNTIPTELLRPPYSCTSPAIIHKATALQSILLSVPPSPTALPTPTQLKHACTQPSRKSKENKCLKDSTTNTGIISPPHQQLQQHCWHSQTWWWWEEKPERVRRISCCFFFFSGFAM